MEKQTCFAYTTKNGKSACVCLTQIHCENCHFFKTEEQVQIERAKSLERLQRIAGNNQVVKKYYNLTKI